MTLKARMKMIIENDRDKINKMEIGLVRIKRMRKRIINIKEMKKNHETG